MAVWKLIDMLTIPEGTLGKSFLNSWRVLAFIESIKHRGVKGGDLQGIIKFLGFIFIIEGWISCILIVHWSFHWYLVDLLPWSLWRQVLRNSGDFIRNFKTCNHCQNICDVLRIFCTNIVIYIWIFAVLVLLQYFPNITGKWKYNKMMNRISE